MSYQSINLAEKLTRFSDLWAPKVVAEMNDYQLKLVKVCGEFVWHTHAHTDEVFHVLAGSLDIWFRDGKVTVNAGEIYVVPKGVEHMPIERMHMPIERMHIPIRSGGIQGEHGFSRPTRTKSRAMASGQMTQQWLQTVIW